MSIHEEIFLNERLLAPLDESFALSAPMCSECAFEPFCGADPVYHHAQFGDYLGHKAESQFCQRNIWIFKYLIRRMETDGFVKNLFLRWANH